MRKSSTHGPRPCGVRLRFRWTNFIVVQIPFHSRDISFFKIFHFVAANPRQYDFCLMFTIHILLGCHLIWRCVMAAWLSLALHLHAAIEKKKPMLCTQQCRRSHEFRCVDRRAIVVFSLLSHAPLIPARYKLNFSRNVIKIERHTSLRSRFVVMLLMCSRRFLITSPDAERDCSIACSVHARR